MLTVVFVALSVIWISLTYQIPEAINDNNLSPLIQDTPLVDLKHTEMLDVVVYVGTNNGSGSGTLISAIQDDGLEITEYHVLTNAHVVSQRWQTKLENVNSITGRLELSWVETPCYIIVFDNENDNWIRYDANIVSEDVGYDLAILSFHSNDKLGIAKIATSEMLNQIQIFDDIFTISCQLGREPTPTVGIIADIITGTYGEKQWVVYGNTAQITPGSSGGGLFREYDGHYYLIGIPFKAATTWTGDCVSHLAQAISIDVARELIDNTVITP